MDVFMVKFGEQTINEALNILNRNQQRTNDFEEEDDQKYLLSLSILNYLKAASNQPKMQRFFRNK
jgi:hypothetical protein